MRIVLAALSLSVAACATTTTTTMFDDRTALISGRDLGWTDQAGVMRKVLRTAAEIGQAKGFDSFDILNAVDASSTGTAVIPGQANTNTTANAYCTGQWCTGAANSRTTATPAQIVDYVKPGADVTVRFYRAGEAKTGAFKIAAILSTQK